MKTLTNLEFKRDGQKNNAIVSRETLGQSKQVTALQEENGVLKYETQDGVKEVKVEKPTNTPYKIMPSDWVVGEAPFKFKTTLKLARTVDDNDVVTLNINNELVKFKNYQIGATNLTAETLDLVSMKKPTEDLKIALVISKTDFLEVVIKPTSARLFEFYQNFCNVYVGDLSVPEIIIPESYSVDESGNFIDGTEFAVTGVSAFGNYPKFREYSGAIVFLENIKTINYRTFNNCKISKITLPQQINIDKEAFYGCSNLTNITFKGTIEQWNAITKGINWNKDVPAKVVHCTDGDAQIGGI